MTAPHPPDRRRGPRPWYQDAISAVALFALAALGGKGMSRTLGPMAAVFFVAITGGLGWMFARAAWRGLLESREEDRHRDDA